MLSSGEIDEIFDKHSVYPQRGSYSGNTPVKFKEMIAYSIFNSAKIIQRAWRTFKRHGQNEFGE